MKKQILILMGVLAVSGTAHAAELFGVPLILSADVSSMGGSTNVGDDYSKPFLIHWGVNGTAAYKFYSIFFGGISGGFTQVSQYSDSTVSGSGSLYRGTRFYLSPTVGADVTEKIRLSLDVNFLGNLSLYAKNASGQSTSFASPLGFRLKAMQKLPWMNERFSAGVQAEYQTYGKMNREGTTAKDLTERQKFWSAGLVIGAGF